VRPVSVMPSNPIDVADAEVCKLSRWQRSCQSFACTTPGVLVCVAIAAAATGLGIAVPLVGGPVFAILLGIVVGNLWRVPDGGRPGIAFCSKKILQLAIIVLGGGLSLLKVYETGAKSLAVMLTTLAAALLVAWVLGRLLKVDRKLTSLVGVGTGICGGSAIAAVAPIIEADDDEIAFSISTVFLFNIVAVVIFPLFGHLMHMTAEGFGIWAGTAINDTSSVVAASYSYAQQAGDVATITKLARTTMIVPIALAFAFAMARGRHQETEAEGDAPGFSFVRVFPWFVLGFLAMALLNSFGVLGTAAPQFSFAGKLLITVALAGVGLGANLRKIIKTGPRPIILGMIVWIAVALISLGVQSLYNQL
jgi:uncharacterized integral membrane protein (TIGR00698 family)